MTVTPLTARDYARALDAMAGLGLSGGVIYDGLVAQVARRLKADLLVTLNPRDFRRVWPEGAERVCEP